MPTISIIIPLYNRENFVAETLDSIVAQTYTDWECIVVDDGSTDHSVEIVQKYVVCDTRFRLLKRPENRIKGAPTCRNIGWENSYGEFIYFFDSDDLLGNTLFEIILNRLQFEKDVDYAVFPMAWFSTSPDKTFYKSRCFQPCKGTLFDQILSVRIQASTPTIIWRRSVLEKELKPWTEELSQNQDADFVRRMIGYAEKGIWCDIPALVYYRIHENSIRATQPNLESMLSIVTHLFDHYKKLGKMTLSVHRILFRSLFRYQQVFSVLSGNMKLSMKYCYTLMVKSDGSVHDRFFVFLSIGSVPLTPFMRLAFLCYNKFGFRTPPK